MAQQGKDISVGKKGMNRDTHPSQVSEQGYSFMLNGNYEDQNGNGIPMLQNEHSNVLCSRLKEGFVVVGIERDITANKTYYFLVNPVTGCSEIGSIAGINNVKNLDDIEVECGCNITQILAEPLEDQEQEETCVYETIITDCCDGDLEGQGCLKFDVRYPVSSELKDAKCGKVLQFTDDLNPIRRLELDNLEQYYYREENCEEDDEDCDCGVKKVTVCLNCDKLKLFRGASMPCISDIEVISGGNLRHGVNVAYIAYCDANGNEVSRYSSITGEIPIKDPNKNIYQQPELDAYTNFSIKFNISNLDITQPYYKLAVKQRTSVDGAVSYFEVGTYPTSKTEVIFSNADESKRLSVDEITTEFPTYLTAKTMESANNALHINDLTAQPEVNLQPVVNLLGQFAKWRTFIAEEDIYARPEFVEKFRGYMRNEVYPLSIRFGTDNYVTANMPLISRVATDADMFFGELTSPVDLDEIIAQGDAGLLDKGYKHDIYSILKNSDSECVEQERLHKWQYYNTASKYCALDCFELDFDLIEVTQERTCENEFESDCSIDSYPCVPPDVGICSGFTLTDLPDDYTFTTFVDFLNDFPDYDGLPECFKASSYVDDESYCCDELDELFPDSCGEPSFVSSEIEVLRLVDFSEDDDVSIFYKSCDYFDRNASPTGCNVFETDTEGTRNINGCCDDCKRKACRENLLKCGDDADDEPCCEWEYSALVSSDLFASCHPKNPVWSRVNPTFGGFACNAASPVPLDSTYSVPTHLSPYYDDAATQLDLYTTAAYVSGSNGDLQVNLEAFVSDPTVSLSQVRKCKSSNGSGNGLFTNYLHKNALWYNLTDIPTGGVIINISDMFGCPSEKNKRDCLLYSEKYRYHIFSKCHTSSNTEFIASGFIEDDESCADVSAHGTIVNTNGVINLTESVFDTDGDGVREYDEIFIVIDAPLYYRGFANDPDEDTSHMGYVLGTCECFSVSANSPVIDRIEVTGSGKVVFNAVCTFESQCTVKVYDDLKCDPSPWEEGKFAYWESTEEYPNNEYLYDSSNLKIKPASLTGILSHTDGNSCGEVYASTIFEEAYANGVDGEGNYILKDSTDFRCKPIRHFKMPSNAIAPFQDGIMEDGGGTAPFTPNKVFPLGIHIDNEIINAFLDIAVENELITQEFRDSINYYEIFRGDTRLHKSIVGKGITYDSWQYDENGKTHEFANFPFNDNRDNKLIYTDSDREDFLEHPDGGDSFNKMFFHSPEFSFEKPNIPFEMEVETYMLGDSKGNFAQVDDHSKMVILSNKAYTVARALAAIETALELATDITDSLIQVAQTSYAGLVVNWGQGVAWASFAIYASQRIIEESLVGGRMKVYEWLKIFDDNGTPYNFASYYAALGYYNKVSTRVDEGDKLRGIIKGNYMKNGRYYFFTKDGVAGSDEISINHFNRSSSVFLYLGDKDKFSLDHSATYKNYDNSRLNSDPTCFSVVTEDGGATKSPDITTNIYSPYISLKRYLPSQYGQIDDISWLSCNYCGQLDSDNSCDAFFGGDSFISRFAFKRHYPFFLNPMVTNTGSLADFTPFSYTDQRNIGFPKYFVDYKIDNADDYGNFELPTIRSSYNFDCFNDRRMYVTTPSKFYLWYYGIPSFLVESRINLNYRHGENNRERDFYPNQTDIIRWTQERNISNSEDNYYFYNNIYSTENDLYAYRTLPANYNPEEWDCRFDHWDRTIYSQEDNNEQDVIDKWQVFKANDYWDFGNKYGRFYGLKNIESEKVLGRFEDGIVVFNAFNTIQGTVEDLQVGNGGRFQTRPTEFYRSDLGYAGTQHRAFVSSEFGHFWTDAKRGRVFAIAPNGGNLEEISRNGMKNWFRENLPFRIQKQFPEIPSDMLDNPKRGIGITMGWDDRYSRLFITKKDVILKDEYVSRVRIEDLNFILRDESEEFVIEPSDATYFDEVSWTVAYNPMFKSWVSYYSFTPNYYVSFNNYFQTGINWGDAAGVWSHLLTNKSFQVFYGDKYPWTIELPLKNNLTKKWYEDFEYKLDVKRYSNEYDYAYREDNFNQAVVYTNREATGYLNLIKQDANNQFQFSQYPKHNSNSWDILTNYADQTWTFNHFFDLVKDNHNSAIWNNDLNNVDKTLNDSAFDYRPTFKNHLRGQYGTIRLVQDKETRLKFIFEHLLNSNKQWM